MTPKSERWKTPGKSAESILNYFWMVLGAYILVAGTYVRTRCFDFAMLLQDADEGMYRYRYRVL